MNIQNVLNALSPVSASISDASLIKLPPSRIAGIMTLTVLFNTGFSSLADGATINIADNSNFFNTIVNTGDILNFQGNAVFYPGSGQSSKTISGALILQSQYGNSIINLSNGSTSGALTAGTSGLVITANNGITFTGGTRSLGSVFYSNSRNLTFGGDGPLIFDGNRATNSLAGAVIYMDGTATLTFNSPETIISNNIGMGSGGSVWIQETVRMKVTGDLTLTNNIGNQNGSATIASYGYGGVLRVGTDILSGSTITTYAFDAVGNKMITLTNNVAGSGGGAINTSGSIRIDGTVIASGNKALGESGGALRAVDFNTSGVELTNPVANHEFKNNKAGDTSNAATSGRGGAIIGKSKVSIAGNALFEGNTARNAGGAVAALYTTGTTGMVTLGNPAATLQFKRNKAGYSHSGISNITGIGGAIHAGHSIILEGTTIDLTENIASSRGGALYAEQNITLTGALNADKNYALRGAGGLLYANELTLTATANTTITGNMAGGTGGAIHLALTNGTNSINAQGGDITFSGNRAGVTFTGEIPNSGTGTANALYLNGATLNLTTAAGRKISFLDPLAGNLAIISPVHINQGGETGTVSFSGENYAANTNDVQSTLLADTTVYAGTFEIKDNAQYGFNGAGSQFNLHAQATLSSFATQAGTQNTIHANDIVLSGTTQLIGPAAQHFVLNGNVSNNGAIILANNGPYNILEISGDYIGNNGSITLNTQLGNESSPTDLVMIGGNASGNTALHINNVNGLGALTSGYGIKIIEVAGISTTTAFNLSNAVVAGAYEYQLVNAPDQSWYLSSVYFPPVIPPQPPVDPDPTDPVPILPPLVFWPALDNSQSDSNIPLYRPDVGINLGNQISITESMVPGFSHNIAPNGIGGAGVMRSDIRLGSPGKGQPSSIISEVPSGQKSNTLWAFMTAKKAKYKALNRQIAYDSETNILQIGGDRSFEIGSKGLVIAGLMANMSQTDTKSFNRLTGSRADGSVDGYGFGAYATWFFDRDNILSPFIDTYLIYGRYDNEVKTRNNIPAQYKSNAWSFTLQGGYPVALSSTIALEPQMQISYVDYSANNYYDHGGTHVSQKLKNNLIGRVGAYIYGHSYAVKPYAALNLWYDSTHSDVRYRYDHSSNSSYRQAQTTTLSSDKKGFIAEAKIGFQTQATRNLTIWGEISGRKGQHDYKDFGGSLGIKYAW